MCGPRWAHSNCVVFDETQESRLSVLAKINTNGSNLPPVDIGHFENLPVPGPMPPDSQSKSTVFQSKSAVFRPCVTENQSILTVSRSTAAEFQSRTTGRQSAASQSQRPATAPCSALTAGQSRRSGDLSRGAGRWSAWVGHEKKAGFGRMRHGIPRLATPVLECVRRSGRERRFREMGAAAPTSGLRLGSGDRAPDQQRPVLTDRFPGGHHRRAFSAPRHMAQNR